MKVTRQFIFDIEYFRCGKCKLWKTRSYFNKDSSLLYGVDKRCRRCRGLKDWGARRGIKPTLKWLKEVVGA